MASWSQGKTSAIEFTSSSARKPFISSPSLTVNAPSQNQPISALISQHAAWCCRAHADVASLDGRALIVSYPPGPIGN
jgi:hypothetical protein